MDAFEKTINKVSKGSAIINVFDVIKPMKPKKGEIAMNPDYNKPHLYASDKEVPIIGKLKAGDTVYLLMQCKVESVSSYSRQEKDKVEESKEACLMIERMAEVK
jgi:hypothetical protein